MNKEIYNNSLSLRNNTIDLFKAIAAYMVVFIHCCFKSPVGDIVDSIARFAVPFFFIVSGYYVYTCNYQKSLKKVYSKIIHLFKITFIGCLIYSIWKICHLDNINQIKVWIFKIVKVNKIIKLILFNDTEIAIHLWFLFALIYCYVLYIIVNKYKLLKIVNVMILILLIVNFLCDEFSVQVLGKTIPTFCIRNFLFCGFPFFMIGNLIYNKRDVICRVKITRERMLILILISVCLSIIERYFFGKHDLYIGSLISSISVFIFSIKFDNIVNSKNILSIIGKRFTLYIYIMHLAVAEYLKDIISYLNFGGSSIIGYGLPIIVCVITTALAVVFYYIKKVVNKIKFIKMNQKIDI